MFEFAKTGISFRRLSSILQVLFLVSYAAWGFPSASDPATARSAGVSAAGGSALAGEELFVGAIRLRNGGPPCRVCHSVAGIPFPNGGTLGPDLTGSYAKLGQTGINATMQTLFFPTMTPIYDLRPLTIEEQRDLKAFFQMAGSGAPLQPFTAVIVSIAAIGFLLLLILTRAWWRHRLHTVRKALVESVLPKEEPQS